MKTSKDVLDAARAKLGDVSAYRLSKVCGVSTQYVSNIYCGRQTIGEGLAVKLADILGCESAEIIAVAAMERAQDESVRQSWERLLERAGVAVLVCAIFTSGGVAMMPASAHAYAGSGARLGAVFNFPGYTLCEVLRILHRLAIRSRMVRRRRLQTAQTNKND